MENKGVSPVIGTILMVAIAIIISALVMAMSYGLAEKTRQSYIVTFQLVDQKADEFTILFYGGPDIEFLQGVKMMVDDITYIDYNGSLSVGQYWYFKNGANPQGPGNQSVTVSLSPGKNDDHLIVVGRFPDNVEAVLIDTYV
ncbi:MAG: type IV pilin [Archaeoglobus sp.]|nr:type IV pilin [Archaeoglobus sp.]